MKKILIFLCFFLSFIFSFSILCFAEDGGEAELPRVDIEIPPGIAEYISPDIYSAEPEEIISSFSFNNAVKTALSFLQKALPEAMEAFLAMLGLIIISAVLAALRGSVASGALGSLLEYISVLCVAAAVFGFVSELFAEFEAFVSQVNSFMSAVIPAVSALLLACGAASSSFVFGAVLSGAVTLLSSLCTSLVLPLLSALLCVYTCAKVCGEAELSGFARLLKSTLSSVLAFCAAAMGCVLAFQSVIAKSADTAAVKGVKFVLGNSVPVVGGALADAVGTLASSLGLLKSTVGVVSSVVICLLFALPVAKLLIWKLVFDAAGAVSAAFSLKKETAFFGEMSEIVGFLAAISASVAVFFIIALTAATAA
jgi:stage III sporulation protein AE